MDYPKPRDRVRKHLYISSFKYAVFGDGKYSVFCFLRVKSVKHPAMKFTGLFMLVVAVLALFVGAGHASPEPKVPIRKIGKVVVCLLLDFFIS